MPAVAVGLTAVVPLPALMNELRAMVVAADLVVLPSEGWAAVRTTESVVAVMVAEAVSLAVLKAVLPPLLVVLA
jgi:hypothetical protein